MKLLVTYNIPREPFQNLPADWEITFPEKEEFSKTELLRILPDYDIMLAIFHAPIDRKIIDAGKKLKLISNYGVGYNNIDITYAREKGIAVTNTPKAVNSPTAELALALMLSAARRIAECNQRIRIEKESMWGTMRNLGFGLEGKTLGIIGLGNIGKNVARKAEAFGMNIIYYNHHTEVPGYRRVELDTLLRESDFVTLHTPLTPATRHLIGQRELSLMKPTAILVNTARGAVVDEQALAEVLKKRQIAGAALDVFEDEPHITETLYALEQLSEEAKNYIAPLPLNYVRNEGVETYFRSMEMPGAKKEDTEKLAKAQALKDATMGWSIAQNIGSYFVHLNGSFHSANQAGIITYLNRYRPGLKIATVEVVRQEKTDKLDKDVMRKADFYICVPTDMTTTY